MKFPLRHGMLSLPLLLGAGCTAEVAPAPPPPYYGAQPAPPPPPGAPFQNDVVYEQPPVPDVQTYPYVVYQGAPVYYVGGAWYRRDGRGWGRYRVEPPPLARERQTHAGDARWAQRPPPPGRR
jgi:hypothetical protein